MIADDFLPAAALAVVDAFDAFDTFDTCDAFVDTCDTFVETGLAGARLAVVVPALGSAARRLAGARATDTLLARAFDDLPGDDLPAGDRDALLDRDFFTAGLAPARFAGAFLAAGLADARLAGDLFAAGLATARFAGAFLAGAFLADAFLAAAISGLPPGGSNEGL